MAAVLDSTYLSHDIKDIKKAVDLSPKMVHISLARGELRFRVLAPQRDLSWRRNCRGWPRLPLVNNRLRSFRSGGWTRVVRRPSLTPHVATGRVLQACSIANRGMHRLI